MLFLCRVSLLVSLSLLSQLIFADATWAWGPAVHMVIASSILGDAAAVMPAIAGVIQAFPLEFVYGNLAADFFVGKGLKHKKGHSHNWETGFRFLEKVGEEQEASYAYGFLSHLAADIVAHNYFVPSLLHRYSAWKRLGHLYWEAKADHSVGPLYTSMAREVLSMEHLGCDELLKIAVNRRGNGLGARKRIYTQSVKFTDYLNHSMSIHLVNWASRYQISPEYLAFMIQLSYRLVRDLLTHPGSSPCLSYDPIGSRNLWLAGKNGLLSKFLNLPRSDCSFRVDQELLEI